VKPLFTLIFIMFCLFANAQPQQVEARFLQDYYYLGNGMDLKSEVNYFVIANRKEFKKLFGVTHRPDTPDFSKEIMLAIIMKQTKWNPSVNMNKICMKAGGFIEVYCDLDEGRHQLTYKTYPLKVCIIPRYPSVTKINFYNNWKMRLLASVPVK